MTRRHARRRATRRPARLIVAALAITVVGTGAVAAQAESWWPQARPFSDSGSAGQRIDVGPVRVKVHDARASTMLSDGLSEIDTDGAWVAVDITTTAVDEPTGIEEMVLRDDRGREFRQASRVENPMIETSFDPAVPTRGEVIFEVPRNAMGDLEIIISPADAGRVIPRATATVALSVRQVADEPLEPRMPEIAGAGDG